jgi:hypothetical protein
MSINPEIKREVLNKLRMAQADLEAIEEEHAGTYDLQPTKRFATSSPNWNPAH